MKATISKSSPSLQVFTKNNNEEREMTTNLDSLDLGVQLPSLIGGNTGGDNRPRNTASPTESSLGRQKDIGDVLVLTEEGKVEDDLNRLDIGGHDNEFADTSVKGLGGFVGTKENCEKSQ